jgi:hypothetical protein
MGYEQVFRVEQLVKEHHAPSTKKQHVPPKQEGGRLVSGPEGRGYKQETHANHAYPFGFALPDDSTVREELGGHQLQQVRAGHKKQSVDPNKLPEPDVAAAYFMTSPW